MTYKTNPLSDAFPVHMNSTEGLTKREYFAAAALQGLATNAAVWPSPTDLTDLAVAAIQYADALIEALNQGENK